MSIVTEKFFNYKSFFIEQINKMSVTSPNDCRRALASSRESFLQEYRTVILNIGRMSGKTTGLLQLGNELSANEHGVVLLVMNPANKRHVQNMISYKYHDMIRIMTPSDILYDAPQNKFKFLLIDESEFTIKNRRHRHEIYEWAAHRGVEFIVMT
ncbi:hypothetical protein Asfd1_180 [Aeromonas phage Asfd_1]|nr:hypothetical protein Asfd1_180 [Aeromonas phage Asfd_1]